MSDLVDKSDFHRKHGTKTEDTHNGTEDDSWSSTAQKVIVRGPYQCAAELCTSPGQLSDGGVDFRQKRLL